MICRVCGAKLDEDSVFCAVCGSPVRPSDGESVRPAGLAAVRPSDGESVPEVPQEYANDSADADRMKETEAGKPVIWYRFRKRADPPMKQRMPMEGSRCSDIPEIYTAGHLFSLTSCNPSRNSYSR